MQLPKSIKIGYASFVDHVSTPALLRLRTTRLFDWIASGDLKVRIGGTYPLTPFFLPLGMKSVSGAWKITTGAAVSVIAVGDFKA